MLHHKMSRIDQNNYSSLILIPPLSGDPPAISERPDGVSHGQDASVHGQRVHQDRVDFHRASGWTTGRVGHSFDHQRT